jgi:hypothetical protein
VLRIAPLHILGFCLGDHGPVDGARREFQERPIGWRAVIAGTFDKSVWSAD